jgi:DNA-binding response OmpR family regulator
MEIHDMKVLLIEDDALLCEMYKIKFYVSKIPMVVAHGGFEGLTMARSEKPNLILLDIKMDDLDGFEVLKQLKRDPKLASIPVFLLTNLSEKDNAEEGLKLGAEAYIMKSKILPKEVVQRVTDRLKTL